MSPCPHGAGMCSAAGASPRAHPRGFRRGDRDASHCDGDASRCDGDASCCDEDASHHDVGASLPLADTYPPDSFITSIR